MGVWLTGESGEITLPFFCAPTRVGQGARCVSSSEMDQLICFILQCIFLANELSYIDREGPCLSR